VPHVGGVGGVLSGKFYLVGGHFDDSGRSGRILEAYDPLSRVWTAKSPIPTARVGCAAAVLGGKLYVLGGTDVTNFFATVESYDPAKDTWAAEPPMPQARFGAGAAVLDGTIFLVGGSPSNSYDRFATLEIRSPAGQWRIDALSMLTPVTSASVSASDGVIFAAGGSSDASAVNLLQYYDVERAFWGAFARLPEVRYNSSGAVVVDGNLYVFGGWDDLPSLGRMPHPDVFVFDIRHNTWRRSAPTSGRQVAPRFE